MEVWLCYPCPHNISWIEQDIEYLLLLLHKVMMLVHVDIYQGIHLHLLFLLLTQGALKEIYVRLSDVYMVKMGFVSKTYHSTLIRNLIKLKGKAKPTLQYYFMTPKESYFTQFEILQIQENFTL